MEKIIYQQQTNGCGYAAIKMLLVHLSKNPQFKYIEEPKIEDKAPNLFDLISWASAFGLALNCYKTPSKAQLLNNKEFPILIVLQIPGLHMVYLHRRVGNSFIVFDPAKGKYKIKCKDLVEQFSGIFLKGTYTYTETNIEKKKIGFFKQKIVQGILELLSFVSIYLGFYFISDNGDFLSPLILFISFVLFKIIQRILLEKSLLDFDKKYSQKIDEFSKPKREKIYKFYLEFKTKYFSGPIQIFSSLFELLILSVLLCLNNLYFAFGLLGVLLASFLFFLFSRDKNNSQVDKINELEAQYLGKIENKNNIKSIDILKETYGYVRKKSYKEIVFAFVDLVVCLLVCLFSQIVSLNFMLFSLIGLIYIQTKFSETLANIDQLDRFKKDKAHFFGYFLRK